MRAGSEAEPLAKPEAAFSKGLSMYAAGRDGEGGHSTPPASGKAEPPRPPWRPSCSEAPLPRGVLPLTGDGEALAAPALLMLSRERCFMLGALAGREGHSWREGVHVPLM